MPMPEFGEEIMELAPIHSKEFFVVQGTSLDLLGSEVTIQVVEEPIEKIAEELKLLGAKLRAKSRG